MTTNKSTSKKRGRGRPRRPDPTVQVAFRFDAKLVERVDAYVKRMQEKIPGLRIARSDAVRSLLIRALDDVEKR